MYTIVEMKFGSHLYGTDTPTSDSDFKAVYIPSARDIVLQRVKDVVVTQTREDRSCGARNAATDIDTETFALHKYLKLLAQGQTVALDMLFAPTNMMISEPDPIWTEIYNNRHKLISRQADSFIGYCRQQANRYGIKGSRMHECRLIRDFFAALMEKPLAKLNEHSDRIYELIKNNNMEHTEVVGISNPNGQVIPHLSCCNRKAPFTITVKEAHKIYDGLFEKYGERTRLAEQNDGVDWKAMSHAVRVGEQAIELLTTGIMQMPRPNADYLKAIKQSQLSFPEVGAYIEELFIEVEKASRESHLPENPDQEWIDNFVFQVYGYQVADSFDPS